MSKFFKYFQFWHSWVGHPNRPRLLQQQIIAFQGNLFQLWYNLFTRSLKPVKTRSCYLFLTLNSLFPSPLRLFRSLSLRSHSPITIFYLFLSTLSFSLSFAFSLQFCNVFFFAHLLTVSVMQWSCNRPPVASK